MKNKLTKLLDDVKKLLLQYNNEQTINFTKKELPNKNTILNLTKEMLNNSQSQFNVVKTVSEILKLFNFVQLDEQTQSFKKLVLGNKYFVTRNDSSLIAFTLPKTLDNIHFQIAASHTDSPTFKLKQKPLFKVNNTYSLNVEPYGGMIMSTFLDRPLSIAGRVIIENKESNALETKIVSVDKDLCVIPNVAIHMNRNVNTEMKFNPSTDTIPLLGMNYKELSLNTILDIKEKIVSHDLFLYNRDEPKICGANDDFLLSPRIDNLTSVYLSILSLVTSYNGQGSINLCALFDNEEVGSLTRQGANSTFMKDILDRICNSLNITFEEKMASLQKSVLLSVDNAHAVNPNHPEYSDKVTVLLNEGIVIKYNANQSYTSDSLSSSIIKKLSENSKIKYQEFSNRSDLRGGSTLGNISNSEVSLLSCDIGLPQLAMHSANELCGNDDIYSMYKLLKEYFDSNILISSKEIKIYK